MQINKTIRQSLSHILNNKFSYFFFFFQLVAFVGMVKIFKTDEFLIINFVTTFILVFIKNKVAFPGILQISFFSSLIILIPIFIWPIGNINLYIGFYIRVFTASLVLLYFRQNFFIYFENLIFILALISLPLFIIQIFYIQFFDIFTGLSELLITKERLNSGHGVLSGHRYLILFTVNSWAELRNSGFAWEPAGYGAMTIWALLINLFLNRFTLNFKYVLLVIAALTTFSIGTYLALFVLLIFQNYNLKIRKNIVVIASVIFLLAIFFSIQSFQDMTLFMSNKGQTYIESAEGEQINKSNLKKLNRVQGALAGAKLVLKSPFGYGLELQSAHGYIHSANGFFTMIYKYGIIGGILIIILLQRNYNYLKTNYYQNARGGILFIIVLLFTMNGNPFYQQSFFLAFLFNGFLMKKIYKLKYYL